jgi:hypothetical protein
VFLAGKSPNIRSYTVYIYGSGQPYFCAFQFSTYRSTANTYARKPQAGAENEIDMETQRVLHHQIGGWNEMEVSQNPGKNTVVLGGSACATTQLVSV